MIGPLCQWQRNIECNYPVHRLCCEFRDSSTLLYHLIWFEKHKQVGRRNVVMFRNRAQSLLWRQSYALNELYNFPCGLRRRTRPKERKKKYQINLSLQDLLILFGRSCFRAQISLSAFVHRVQCSALTLLPYEFFGWERRPEFYFIFFFRSFFISPKSGLMN